MCFNFCSETPMLETEELAISSLEGDDVTFTCRISSIIDFVSIDAL